MRPAVTATFMEASMASGGLKNANRGNAVPAGRFSQSISRPAHAKLTMEAMTMAPTHTHSRFLSSSRCVAMGRRGPSLVGRASATWGGPGSVSPVSIGGFPDGNVLLDRVDQQPAGRECLVQ